MAEGFHSVPRMPRGMEELSAFIALIDNKESFQKAVDDLKAAESNARKAVTAANKKIKELQDKADELALEQKKLNDDLKMAMAIQSANVDKSKELSDKEEEMENKHKEYISEMKNGRSEVRTGLLEVEKQKKELARTEDELNEREMVVAAHEEEMKEWKKKMRALGVNKR